MLLGEILFEEWMQIEAVSSAHILASLKPAYIHIVFWHTNWLDFQLECSTPAYVYDLHNIMYIVFIPL